MPHNRSPWLLLLLTLAGCGSLSWTPPQPRAITDSATIAAPFDEVWADAVAWFASHNITLDKVEKTSGLLTAKYELAVDDRILDAGQFSTSGIIFDGPHIRRTASLNVVARPIDDNYTRVTINLFGKFRAWAYCDQPPSGLREQYGDCVSTGALEAALLRDLAR